jgi:hypothetical protein
MKKNRNRERVIAEITLFHLMRPRNEHGCSVSREQAIAFLNEEERARDVESHDASWYGFHLMQLISAARQPGMVRKDARIHAVCHQSAFCPLPSACTSTCPHSVIAGSGARLFTGPHWQDPYFL